jgi:hypothetical protein
MAAASGGFSRKFVAAMAAAMFVAGSSVTAEAHGGRHAWAHAAIYGVSRFVGDERHGNDAYTKAASEKQDKLLNSKLKDICRG